VAALLWFAAMLLLPEQLCGQVAVIAHKSVPFSSVELGTLLDVYTLNTKHWSDGSKITVLELKGDSQTKSRFYSHLNTSPVEMQKMWLKKQFAGKSLPPTAVSSEQEVIDKVGNTPGAIGYVSAEKMTKEASKDVKILAMIK
jgi:ABC-type phosphate transport system substrate-binding protein